MAGCGISGSGELLLTDFWYGCDLPSLWWVIRPSEWRVVKFRGVLRFHPTV